MNMTSRNRLRVQVPCYSSSAVQGTCSPRLQARWPASAHMHKCAPQHRTWSRAPSLTAGASASTRDPALSCNLMQGLVLICWPRLSAMAPSSGNSERQYAHSRKQLLPLFAPIFQSMVTANSREMASTWGFNP